MSERHQELAEKVVSAFKERLSEHARGQITDAQFEDLSLMIREVIAVELEGAANLMDEVLKKLRADIEKPDLGL